MWSHTICLSGSSSAVHLDRTHVQWEQISELRFALLLLDKQTKWKISEEEGSRLPAKVELFRCPCNAQPHLEQRVEFWYSVCFVMIGFWIISLILQLTHFQCLITDVFSFSKQIWISTMWRMVVMSCSSGIRSLQCQILTLFLSLRISLAFPKPVWGIFFSQCIGIRLDDLNKNTYPYVNHMEKCLHRFSL